MVQFYSRTRVFDNIYVQFLCDWLLQIFASISFISTICGGVMYFLGMCLYIHTLVDVLKANLSNFDDQFKPLKRSKTITEIENRRELAENIKLHYEIIE